MNNIFRKGVSKMTKIVMDSIIYLLDCEIECIKDGNSLTPHEQDLCIETVDNIRERMKGTFYIVKPTSGG